MVTQIFNFPTRTERGDATASDCFIRQLRVWYSIHRDGVLQPEDRHALILVSRQGQRLYYLRPHLVWLGNGADTSRDDARPAPLSFPPFGCYDDKPRGCCLVGLACAKNLPKNDFFFHRASERKLSHSTLALLPALVPAPAEVKDEHQAGECGAPLRKP